MSGTRRALAEHLATQPLPSRPQRCVEAINKALHDIFAECPEALLLGEDVLDPYGGAFKVTRGLSTAYPDRVLTTPISEAAITGIAAGMALRGLRPIVEIMFGDFMTLTFDQVVNHIAKFEAMYNGQVKCPVVIRTPMGGRRGYGPTHSQSIEKFFIGIPHLRVIAPSPVHPIPAMLRHAVIEDDGPVLWIENKIMYGELMLTPERGRIGDFACRIAEGPYPAVWLSLCDFEEADVTLITYGGSTTLAMKAATELLIEEEIFADVVVLAQLSPVDVDSVASAVRHSGRAVFVEEGTRTGGVGAEWAASIQERLWEALRAPVARVAAEDDIIPSARHLEDAVLPDVKDIVATVHGLLGAGRHR
ncbi:MAG: transketolase C-terminal domain-containing protein [Anaerolineae bacterium]